MKGKQKDVIKRLKQHQNHLPTSKTVNHLFLIGIDEYHSNQISDLNNCVRDCLNFKEVLLDRYKFEKKNVTELYNNNATKRNINATFRNYIRTLSENDNLIIYFSGHGQIDELTEDGLWIPTESIEIDDVSCVTNKNVLDYFKKIKSKHIFLICDSCYGGNIFKDYRIAASSSSQENYKSRFGLASGRSNQIVSDGRIGTNSPFAKELIKFLEFHNSPKLAVGKLMDSVKMMVKWNEEDQTPDGRALTGHQGGMFYLYLNYKEATKIINNPSRGIEDEYTANSFKNINKKFEDKIEQTEMRVQEQAKSLLFFKYFLAFLVFILLGGSVYINIGTGNSSAGIFIEKSPPTNNHTIPQQLNTSELSISPSIPSITAENKDALKDPLSSSEEQNNSTSIEEPDFPPEEDNNDSSIEDPLSSSEEDENNSTSIEESGFTPEDDNSLLPKEYIEPTIIEDNSTTNAITYDYFNNPRDSKEYRTIELAGNRWLADNLNTDYPKSFCYNCDSLGRLYNWNIAKIICPEGWRLPKKVEWEALIEAFEGESTAFFELQKSGSSGFEALFAGDRVIGEYQLFGKAGYFWSFDEESPEKAYYFAFNKDSQLFYGKSTSKRIEMSCRCVEDKSNPKEILDVIPDLAIPPITNDGTFTDDREDESKSYRYIVIDNLHWMIDNLDYASPASKRYADTEVFAEKYGRLYNWQDAVEACPNGWRLPSPKEWDKLLETLKVKPDIDFNIQKGGIQNLHNNGEIGAIGGEGYFWSSLGDNESKKAIFYKFSDTEPRSFEGKISYGMSCRCVRENGL